jgi:hypothetical protein
MHAVRFFQIIVVLSRTHSFNSCPIECRLSRTDKPWQCIVSLRFIVDASGQLLDQVRNEQFGDIIYDKAEVEARIRRAQHAILNPHKTRESVLNEGSIRKEDPSLPKFSVNCVTLQISGPDVADLSFCDLPGAICRYNFLLPLAISLFFV